MSEAIFNELTNQFNEKGPEQALDHLCTTLEANKDYANLFYALLMKKRHELGITPIPTSPAQQIPEELHAQYEEAIRKAATSVGQMCLKESNIAQAYNFFNLLGDTSPVAQALENYSPAEEEDAEPVVNIAFHQGVNPKRGFDLILDRWGICSAITILGSQEFPWGEEARDYCIKQVIRTLHAELTDRLINDISSHETAPDEKTPISELVQGRPYLFGDDMFHVDLSHLSAVVQMSINLEACEERDIARELCEYGRRLSKQFQFRTEPPFDDLYADHAVYLDMLAGKNIEDGIAHFRKKVEDNNPENYGTFPAEVLVNLLLRLDRPQDALDVAKEYLKEAQDRPLSCPNLVELCEKTKNYQALSEISQQLNNPVHYLAGLLGERMSVNGK